MERMLLFVTNARFPFPWTLYNAEYLVFLIIPEGWIDTLGLGEDVWRIRCQELLVVCPPRANPSLAGPCGLMEVG